MLNSNQLENHTLFFDLTRLLKIQRLHYVVVEYLLLYMQKQYRGIVAVQCQPYANPRDQSQGF